MPAFWGILVTLGIGTLLGEVLPDYALPSVLPVVPILAVQIQSALQIVVAVFAGAIVARGRFLGPALVLAVLGWGAVVYIAYDIARLANDPGWGDFAIRNLLGLLLYIAAATVGALLGERFYMRRLGNRGTAA
jgi:hypothetical protein